MLGAKLGIISKQYNIVTDGLVVNYDPAFNKCYPGGSDIFNLASGSLTPTGSIITDATFVGTDGSDAGYMYFDGSDGYINIETSILSYISNVSTFSIGMWAKPKLSSEFMAMGNATAGTSAPRQNYGTWNDGNMYLNIGETGGTTGCSISISYTNWDNWSYWVCTYDKTQGSHAARQKGYIDGIDPGGWGYTGNSGNNTGTIPKFYLGYIDNWSSYAYGNLGSIQIYNRALTAAEVLQNYNASKDRYTN